MARPSYPNNVIADLITGRLPWEQTKRIMSDYKDADRFDKYIAVLQTSVPWREYICPGCATLLEVDAVPPGWPVIFDFLPDLEGFYEEWLGRPLPNG
jgi:acetone carboxylase gamma subunit